MVCTYFLSFCRLIVSFAVQKPLYLFQSPSSERKDLFGESQFFTFLSLDLTKFPLTPPSIY